MHVLLDIHVASNDQQSAVACSIASSHEDLHEMTSISSCAVSFQVMCHKEWISAWNSYQQPRFILINKFFQQFLIDGLQTVPSTNLIYGQNHHNLRINFGIHHTVLHEFFHPSRLAEPILHPSRFSGYFSKFSNFSHPSRPSNYFSKFFPFVETC